MVPNQYRIDGGKKFSDGPCLNNESIGAKFQGTLRDRLFIMYAQNNQLQVVAASM